MKTTKILYWTITILFGGFMLSTAIPNIMNNKDSIDFIHTMMGFPLYFIPFIGVAKVLGVIGILVPGFPRIKEWAYAGLTFDLVAATYSFIAMGNPFSDWAMMLLIIAFCLASYVLYHKKAKAEGSTLNTVA